MTTDEIYRAVMMVDASTGDSLSDSGGREHLFGEVWARPGLSTRDRRFVTLACVAGVVDVPQMDAHIYAALKSGDLPIAQLNEFTLHFAVYCGWPKASQFEQSVRTQWQRVHEDVGEPAPAVERIAEGAQHFEEINLISAPAQDSPYFYAGILNFVFGHVWRRPGLTRRERRLITIPCVGVSDAMNPIWSHVTSALGSGDISYTEMEELILHFSAYSTPERAERLEAVAEQWRSSQS
jgi:4-carboxymuconolactone decarboxylase